MYLLLRDNIFKRVSLRCLKITGPLTSVLLSLLSLQHSSILSPWIKVNTRFQAQRLCFFTWVIKQREVTWRTWCVLTDGRVNDIPATSIYASSFTLTRASLPSNFSTSHFLSPSLPLPLKSYRWHQSRFLNYPYFLAFGWLCSKPSAVFFFLLPFLSPLPHSPPLLEMRELSELPWPAPVGQMEEEPPIRELGDLSPRTPRLLTPLSPAFFLQVKHTCIQLPWPV